jgi:hypothetical protein
MFDYSLLEESFFLGFSAEDLVLDSFELVFVCFPEEDLLA